MNFQSVLSRTRPKSRRWTADTKVACGGLARERPAGMASVAIFVSVYWNGSDCAAMRPCLSNVQR